MVTRTQRPIHLIPALFIGAALWFLPVHDTRSFAIGARGSASPRGRNTALSASKEEVEQKISGNDMVVFQSSWCPFCQKAVSALQQGGFQPLVIEVDAEMKATLTEMCGSGSVPKVFVKGQFVGGCNNGGLGGTLPLLANGKIAEMMAS